MGRSSKYVVTPGAASDGDQVPLPWLVSTLLLLTSFTLYLLDQATDALTALLYFLDVSLKCVGYLFYLLSCQGHTLEGCLTSLLILAPGLASCCLELRAMWRGHGHCGLALAQLGLCPLTSLLTHLYSIFNPRWRPRALLQKTMEVMRTMIII